MTTKNILRNNYSARLSSSHKNSGGFTLVETLVAISILLVAVVGPISLIGDALHKLYYAKDEMVAINLAEEGIEAVRQVRDSNMLTATAWDTGLGAGDYVVNANSATSVAFCGLTCAVQPVYLDAQGFYQQSTVLTATPFGRIVTITSIGTDERVVTSKVTWRTGGDIGNISVTEYLFKWALP
ncbi:MAG: prepilin-type N-terminal cleavage/methylation domain-containing protein [Candidatus Yonathbacteria bacterium]|nr:prepilin-type N-terminal cleavage/methylation domain-containing protein [Candidatus Yonathbacteria bacterium]